MDIDILAFLLKNYQIPRPLLKSKWGKSCQSRKPYVDTAEPLLPLITHKPYFFREPNGQK